MYALFRSCLKRDISVAPEILKCKKSLMQCSAGLRSAPANESTSRQQREPAVSPDVRFKYPEFLPHPFIPWRNPIREKLERRDMINRRNHISIPEFYVGTIMAVTSATDHAPEKVTRFVGICIRRSGTGLCTTFTLRNFVDNQGVEVIYELYDPKLQKIEVLRLEKRLDDDLEYLRDAEPEYSTFPFDMEMEFLPEGEPVPVNPIQVKLRGRPYRIRHENKGYKGVAPFETSRNRLLRLERRTKRHERPIKYDLMWHYRNTIPEEEQREIYAEVCSELQETEMQKKKSSKRTNFVPPKKTA